MRLSMLNKAFITGCDENCEWQLPWFLENYFEFNETPLIFMDFGITAEAADLLGRYDVEIVNVPSSVTGWFKKPKAILEATKKAKVVCWLDTDCQVMGDISGIFKYYKPNMLGMVQDRPWTARRGLNGEWHNSGVVLTNKNNRLIEWSRLCETNPKQGDQEVLYYSMNPIERIAAIYSLPHQYNTLRLDYIDNIDVNDPLIIHHTGREGNKVIQGQINE